MSYSQLHALKITGYTQDQIDRLYPAQSPREREEALNSYFDHLPKYISRGKLTDYDRRKNVIWIKGFEEDGKHVRSWSYSSNIITVDGRQYYARLAQRNPAFSFPTNEDFGSTSGRFQMANPTTQNTVSANDTWDQFDSATAGGNAAGTGAAIAGSIKAFTTNYPMVSDPDSDNTGDGANVVTYQVFYGQADFTADPTFIKNGCIHAMGASAPTNSTKLLCHFTTPTTTGVQKQSTDTLKVITNHPVSSS